MKRGDLVRVYTIANTHIERGAYGIVVKQNTYNPKWWIVYIMTEGRLFTFHEDQLRLIEADQERDKIDIHKSYPFFDED